MREYRTISIPISFIAMAISLAVHVVLFLLLSLKFFDLTPSEPQGPKVLRIERIETPRTVGQRLGAKDFMAPLEKGSHPDAKQVNPLAKNPTNSSASQQVRPDSLSFEALKTENIKIDDIKPLKQNNMEVASKTTPSNFKVTSSEASKLQVTKQEALRERQRDQNRILQEMSRSQDSAEAIAGKGFALDFIPPEGVSEDELNSMEKMYFSFQRRTFMTYVGSFIKSYETIGLKKPNLKNALKNEEHHLAARVTFDEAGNIQLIKIIKSVPNDDVHLLFEETLKGMRSLPNPPKDMIESDGTFTIYFQLKIN